MFQSKYVFVQLASFLNQSKFNRIAGKYNDDKYVSSNGPSLFKF